MKSILRSFQSPKHLLLLLHTTRSLSCQFPPFSRQLHSTSLRLFSTEELGPDSPGPTGAQSTPPRWSIYGPATASLDTSSGSGEPEQEQEPERASESSLDGGDDLGREKKDRSSRDSERKHVRGKTGYTVGDFVGVRRKGKSSRETWVCADCGHSDGQWWGTCRSCHSVGTLKKFFEVKSGERHVEERTWLPQKTEEVQPMRLQDVNRGINQQDWRIPLFGSFGSEVARVLGGGIVPGSLVLIGGDPGVGKGTLLLQMAAIIAEGRDLGDSAPVVYVSGEESIEQIGHRADRMNIGPEELFLYSSTDVEVLYF
ncbi:hypothetical protein Q3G72_002109 [Acer saccharum]|nr:hypothetical protein Q3G72_002109 [Acer saccharum]